MPRVKAKAYSLTQRIRAAFLVRRTVKRHWTFKRGLRHSFRPHNSPIRKSYNRREFKLTPGRRASFRYGKAERINRSL